MAGVTDPTTLLDALDEPALLIAEGRIQAANRSALSLNSFWNNSKARVTLCLTVSVFRT